MIIATEYNTFAHQMSAPSAGIFLSNPLQSSGEVKNVISENLQFLRKRFHFSQEEVAERIGVSRQAVAKWESGETIPDLTNSVKLAELYDVTLDDLVHHRPEEAHGMPIAPKGRHIFGAVTVGDKGQIVIPVKARKIFQIQPGDALIVLGDERQGLALIKQQALMAMLDAIREQREE